MSDAFAASFQLFKVIVDENMLSRKEIDRDS